LFFILFKFPNIQSRGRKDSTGQVEVQGSVLRLSGGLIKNLAKRLNAEPMAMAA